MFGENLFSGETELPFLGVLNILTVKWGKKYTPESVNKMFSMAKRHIDIPFNFYCFTDDASGLSDDIKVIPLTGNMPGWWNKMIVFSPEAPVGRNLYLDLDQVIMGDLTKIIKDCKAKIACYADHIHWLNCKFGSAFMLFDGGEFTTMWLDFYKSRESIYGQPGGDQIFIGGYLPSDEIEYLDEKYPNLAASYKFDILDKGKDPYDYKIVNFHGDPKPSEVVDLWVQENWQ